MPGGERCDPQLSSLAQAADMRAGAEMDIGAPKADQLGHPQACLGGKPKQGVVAPARPGRRGWSGQQCVEFRFGQESHKPPVETLGRNGEYTLDHSGMLRVTKCGVSE